MTKPLVDKDSSDFVNDPNFKKLVELFFGEGTKTTFRKEWVEYVDEPVLKILLIHVPHLDINDANDRLMKFYELMQEMRDYPINLIIDTNYSTQEKYLESETTTVIQEVTTP